MFTTLTGFREVNVSRFIKVAFYIAIIASLIGCQPLTLSRNTVTPVASTPQIQVTLLPPTTIEPTPECMPVPSIDIDVVLLSSNSIHVKVTGLKPGENVKFVFYSEVTGQTFKIESSPLEGADNNGSIEFVEDGLDQISGGKFKEWQLQVIHSNGVACADFDLPE